VRAPMFDNLSPAVTGAFHILWPGSMPAALVER
jgi:hypothetical protein